MTLNFRNADGLYTERRNTWGKDVAPVGKNYYSWQLDNETGNGMDGYAGAAGVQLGKLQVVMEQSSFMNLCNKSKQDNRYKVDCSARQRK